jgi:hypothetical protein
MLEKLPLFAFQTLENLLPAQGRGGSGLGAYFVEILIVLGVVLGLTLLLVLWAAYLRRPKRRRSNSHSHADPVVVKVDRDEDDEESEEEKPRRRGRRRRVKVRYRRREHRPTNPTLAETGGLPPPRPEGE